MAFYRLDDLLHAMKRDAELAPQRLRRKKYNNVSMRIIDEGVFEERATVPARLMRMTSF